MSKKTWVSALEAANYLNVTKPQVFRLINENKIIARLITDAPIQYYLIELDSLEKYKKSPKNKGGRPKKGNKS